MKTKTLFLELAPDYSPKYDPWGHAMGAFFDVAGELWRRGCCTPDAWHYSPGAGGPDVSEDAEMVFAALDVTDNQLRRLGAFLHRLTGRIERAGLSY